LFPLFVLAALVGIAPPSVDTSETWSLWRTRPVLARDAQIPCRDPRGCPDLAVDGGKLNQWHVELLNFDADDCAVRESCVDTTGTRLVMRFTSNTPNFGKGDLIIGDPTTPENADFFETALCHRHLHFKEYADYRLWTPEGYKQWRAIRDAADPEILSSTLLDANPAVKANIVVGRKQGFCVIDLLPANTPGAGQLRPGQPKYLSCRRNQGISNGYADEYIFLLDCQWFDITNVAAGKYILEDEVNAEHVFAESNYANNAAAVEVSVPSRQGRGGVAQMTPKRFVPYGCQSCSDAPVPVVTQH
jgi:hypothetical protein